MSIRLIILTVVLVIFGAIAIEAFLRRNRPRKSLAEQLKPNFGAEETKTGEEKVPLGMEAIDMKMIKDVERLNSNIDHRNPSLKRRK